MEKDYRSLEHKIRDLLVSEAMAKNSAKRMQVTNVARPDTATDPTDVKSKIAKQGEIKTKIIDEETEELDEGKVARHNIDDWHKTAKEKGYTVKKYDDGSHQAWTPDKRSGGPRVVGHHDGKKGWIAKEEVEIEAEQIDELSSALLKRAMNKAGNKAMWLRSAGKENPGFKKAYAQAKKFQKVGIEKEKQEKAVKEEAEEVDEAKRKFGSRGGRGPGYKSPWDKIEKAAPGIGARIDAHVKALNDLSKKHDEKKDVKEDTDAPVVDDKKKKDAKAPKKTDMDDMDAKEIKGGKTEVEVNPKTDDRPEDQSAEDAKSKKTTKQENKKIGAKGGVKEETMANTPFGLPADLIATVAEALKGGQKKLDKNHNGKIDGQDFAILRAKKDMKEEACQKCGNDPCTCHMKEEKEEVNELSKDKLQRYVRAASSDAANHAYTAGKGAHGKMTINRDEYHQKADQRLRGISKAAQKLAKEENEVTEEQIDELSKKTVQS